MNKVVITSKTRMSQGYCVGGYDISDGKYIRLLTSDGKNQGYYTKFEVGQLWRLSYKHRLNTTPPHVEDVLVSKQIYIKTIADLSNYILQRLTPYNGSITGLFENKLRFTNNGGPYINRSNGLPNNSVGFWLIPEELNVVRTDEGRIRYKVKTQIYEMPYVGLEPAVDSIPAGSLVRVSLARWWSPNPEECEERCYVQLSGWY
ncbi:hypothetical protein L5M28_19215 [Shewanella sp. SW32]|uniref:dual OB domain-containing protein n=1 Tax=unclassified Shewanella TaxID=196818 RepID=UPI0021DAA5EF|nr:MULTISPECIES: hypothetical protein [unclassified Shewanella]MCU7964681.1 hypothetical protein [Shewanella sp. SW32]MCU7972606.1 hypothetical protein [Shewanella sp. SW29]